MTRSHAVVFAGLCVLLAALDGWSVTFDVVSLTDRTAVVRFTLDAGDSAVPPQDGACLLGFASAPGLAPRVSAESAPPAAGAFAVSMKSSGWAGPRFLQWVAFRPYAARGGRMVPLTGSGTLTIDYGAPVIDVTSRLKGLVDHGIVAVPLRPGLAKRAAVAPPPLPYSIGVSIAVTDDGIYAITGAALKKAGVPVSRISSRQFCLFERDREVPVYITNPHRSTMADDDLVLFYGRKLRGAQSYLSQFSNTNVYWLTWNTGRSGVRIAQVSGALRIDETIYRAGDTTTLQAREFRDTVHLETDGEIRWLGGINEPQELTEDPAAQEFIDNWYWGMIGENELTHFDIPVCSPSTKGTARLRFGLIGISKAEQSNDHSVEILLNNAAPLDGKPQVAVWDGQEDIVFTTDWFPVTELKHGVNTITFLTPTRGFADVTGLNWIEIEYPRRFEALNDVILFKNNPLDVNRTKQFAVEGFSSPSIDLWDISRNRILSGFEVRQVRLRNRTAYSAVFQDSVADVTTFLAQTVGSRRTPAMALDTIADSWDFPDGLDYVMITSRTLMPALTPLAEYYRGLGWKVAVLDIVDVYNRFSYGIRDPEAVRTMLKYLAASCGGRPPRYLLLGGDTSHDLDKIDGTMNVNIVPTHLSRIPRWGPASDDGYFATVAGDDNLPDMYVGRLPAASVDQMERMVQKTLRHLRYPSPGFWRDQMLLVGGYDQASLFDDFCATAERDIIGPRFSVSRLDADPSSPYYVGEFSAAQRVADAINAGVRAVNFIGHGGGNVWSDSRFFSFTDLNKLHNDQWGQGGRLPFVFSFTCLTGFFESIYYASLGEEILRTGMGGCVGYYGASAYTSREGNLIMDGLLLRDASAESFESVGEMLWLCETKMLVMDETKWLPLVRQYNLLGDPAATWKLPPDSLAVQIDKTQYTAGDTLAVRGTCPPVNRGTARVRVTGDGRVLGDRTLPVEDAAFSVVFPVKDSAMISRGVVHAYAWSDTSDARGWAEFSKDRLNVTDVRTEPPLPQWGDDVTITCRIATPLSGTIDAVRCLYTVGSPTTALAAFAPSGETGMQHDSLDLWSTTAPIPLRYPGTSGASLIVRFRVAGPNIESDALALPVRGMPDLRFSGTVPAISWTGDSLCVSFGVLNGGDAATPPFSIGLSWITAGGDVQFSRVSHRDSLAAGATVRFMPAFADTQGDLSVRIALNPDSAFDELSAANNQGAVTSSVRIADLRGTDDTLRSPGDGLRIVPVVPLSKTARCFLFTDSMADARLPAENSRWLPLHDDPVRTFTVQRRPAAADSTELLRWIFLTDTSSAGLPRKTAAAGVKPAIVSYDSGLGLWRYTATTVKDSGPLLLTETGRPGPFAAALLGDLAPPRIAVSVAGHRLVSLDYAAKNNPFDIFITDPSGMAADGIDVRLNQHALSGRALSQASVSDDRRVARLTAYPPKENRIDSLTIAAADLSGNDTSVTFAYLPGEALAIRFLACHPNPFTARHDARGEVMRPIKLAYLLTDVADKVTMTVYTMTGITVASWKFYDQIGYQEVVWDGLTQRGRRIANGTYYLKLTAQNGRTKARKILKIAKLEGY